MFFNSKKRREKEEQERLRIEREEEERLKKQERIRREIEDFLNDLENLKRGKQQYTWNNYDYYKNKNSYNKSQHDYKNIFDDENFERFFKQARENSYRNQQSYSSYNPNKSLDNAFQLMKLNKDDDEMTIKKRYRELSLKWHPDRWTTNTAENQAIAGRNFVKLNTAYELIKKYKNIK